MNLARCLIVSLFVFLPLLGGCKGEQPKGSTPKEYDIKAKVVAVDPNQPAVTLDHEDIPGLMKAMKMEFTVADRKLVEGIKAGDEVHGRLRKGDSGMVITELKNR